MKVCSKLSELYQIKKSFGVSVAFWNVVFKMYKKSPQYSNVAYFINNRKHIAVLKYLRKTYSEVIDKYRTCITNEENIRNSKIIWTIWWQGEAEIPETLKLCVESMKKYNNGHEVIIITKYNYNQYIELPNYILTKVEEGRINYIHLADIIRMYLMSKYGGIWLDATIFLSNVIPEEYLDYDYFTTKLNRTRIACISECRWNGTVFGGKAGVIFFDFMVDFYYQYWKKEECIIDYFLIDYMTAIAYESQVEFKNQLDALPINNPQIFNITPYMNETYDCQVYMKLCENTCFHKIQRRQKYYTKNNEGTQTLYGYLCEMIISHKK